MFVPLLRRLQQSLYFVAERYAFHIVAITKPSSDVYRDFNSKIKEKPQKGSCFNQFQPNSSTISAMFTNFYVGNR